MTGSGSIMDFQSVEFRHWELLFDIRRSVRYHDHRRNHYLRIQEYFQFLQLVLGAAAVVQYLGTGTNEGGLPLILLVAPALVAILSAILIAFRVAEMATKHSRLYERFIELEKEAGAVSDSNSDQVNRLRSKVLEIEIDEPSVFHAVNIMCHNEVARSQRCREDSIYRIRTIEWLLKDFCRFKRMPYRLLST